MDIASIAKNTMKHHKKRRGYELGNNLDVFDGGTDPSGVRDVCDMEG